ncbi:DUF262 domain-containing protein [Catellatospora sp. NPDC049133]|uniref:DUF262 domain-containing protein n=1 Tax=Catellatospora sp. NPDC049133 TaxID=3155499 RepID=UPI0033E41ECE
MTTSGIVDVHEELFEGEATGLEVEQFSDGDPHKPWDPDKIRVSTKTFSLRNIIDMVNEKSLELAPDFQRNKVWKARQKSRLIESILLQIPLPAFYFSEDADGMLRVVDGLQRLSTVLAFTGGDDDSFALENLEYLDESKIGKTFDSLEAALRRRLHNTQIVVHVIDPTTPPEVTYNIFKRLNTGGTPLNAQEIRHCMTKERSRNFLRDCAANPNFHVVTGGSLRNNVRMGDREAVLRFCAFRLRGPQEYQHVASMDAFLLETSQMLDDIGRVSDEVLNQLLIDFDRAMVNAYAVFGDQAFRKWWSLDQKGRNPINRPLLESWSVALAELTTQQAVADAEAIRNASFELMGDPKFVEAISTSTGDRFKVAYRFERTRGAVK